MAANPTDTPIDWETCDAREGLVATSFADINISTCGPARQSGSPVIVFESGTGMSGACWAAVARLLAASVRTYRYDRAGLGHSKESSAPRTASKMAAELLELLQTAKIRPPYILVSHTYGAFIARELLACAPAGSIVGMVIIDGTQEHTLAVLRPFEGGAFEAIASQVDYLEVVGLRKEHKFTPEEWERFEQDSKSPTQALTSKAEDNLVLDSAATLEDKKQFERHPLSPRRLTFIAGSFSRDMERLLAAAKKEHIGTPQQIADCEAILDRVYRLERGLHQEQLKLSSDSQLLHSKNSGHMVHFTEPKLVADEVKNLAAHVEGN